MQSWVRTRTPPAGPGELLRLGLAADGTVEAIGALSLVATQSDFAIVKLLAVAINVAVRGQGGAVADAALDHVLGAAFQLGSSAGAEQTIAVAWVHPRNEASRRMLTRHGLEMVGMVDEYEDWRLILTI